LLACHHAAIRPFCAASGAIFWTERNLDLYQGDYVEDSNNAHIALSWQLLACHHAISLIEEGPSCAASGAVFPPYLVPKSPENAKAGW
jgi:hypothetical protein